MESVIGPKRGVSAYCYGDLYITSTLEDIMMDMQDMGATGIEILGNGHIDGYPNMTDDWVEIWHRLCKKYEIEPVEYGHWIESRMFEHHSLNVLESVEMLERDIKIAARLGFPVLRTKLGVIDGVLTPVTHWREIISRALPTAEQYGVVMCPEIHIPTKLKSKTVDDYVEFIEKHNTKHFGLNIDFGTFQTVFAPDFYAIPEDGKPCSYPKELIPLLPYIYCCHAKFNHIDESFHETTIPYPEIIQVLVDHHWDGYMLSEYEGPERMKFSQVSDQLRRQHIMMKRILGY